MVTEVARNYVMPRDNSVQAFLNSHRVLPQLLLQALPRLRHRFGDTVFALRATSDEYGWQNLSLTPYGTVMRQMRIQLLTASRMIGGSPIRMWQPEISLSLIGWSEWRHDPSIGTITSRSLTNSPCGRKSIVFAPRSVAPITMPKVRS
jgi:hypothetical protein